MYFFSYFCLPILLPVFSLNVSPSNSPISIQNTILIYWYIHFSPCELSSETFMILNFSICCDRVSFPFSFWIKFANCCQLILCVPAEKWTLCPIHDFIYGLNVIVLMLYACDHGFLCIILHSCISECCSFFFFFLFWWFCLP